jgi:glycosyltransferase involved in cell wall biosynthesis
MLGQGNVVPQPAAFYTREALESVGFLDERWQMIMDFAVTMRVGLRFPSVCLPDHLARFRDHAASKSRRRHGAMARELLRLIDELEGEVGGSPDWPALRRRAVARIHYEWALACVASEGRGNDAVYRREAIRHLRSSLRSDPGFVMERGPQTAYLVKEVARAAISVRPRPSPEPHEGSVDTAGHPLRVQLIGRFDDQITGLSRYTHGLRDGLLEAGLDVELTFPPRPPIPAAIDRRLRATGIDIGSFFSSYPLRASLIRSDIYHLTDQMLATLLLFQRIPGPVVVTVMDIIPYLVQHSRELNTFRHQVDAWFYRLALAGLRRADALVVISEYTKATLVEVLGLPAERVHVIYPAIDHRRFRPMDMDQGFLQRYGLSSTTPYVLYVGSEDPRKNLPTLIRAIGRVREQLPDVVLLKVGQAQFVRERRRLSRLVQSLRLGESVRFLEAVPDQDLPLFYNLASVCVLPSLYEGFGLPMVEAMACGTPVVHARSGPLPEVAGEAGIEVDARDPAAFAEAIMRLIRDPAERTVLRQAGLREAARFTWRNTAAETRALYAGLVATGGGRG